MRGCSGGGGVHSFSDEIRSMSRQYASYWNAFLFPVVTTFGLLLPVSNVSHTGCHFCF